MKTLCKTGGLFGTKYQMSFENLTNPRANHNQFVSVEGWYEALEKEIQENIVKLPEKMIIHRGEM